MSLLVQHRATGPILSEQFPGLWVASCSCRAEFAAWTQQEVLDAMRQRGCLPAEDET